MRIRYITSNHSITGIKEKDGKENEDSFFLVQKKISDKDMAVFAGVADGMGGLSHGKEVSQYVAKTISSWFEDNWEELISLKKKEFADKLLCIIRQIHCEISEKIKSEWNYCQAGSTLALVYSRGTSYIAANIGDSRIYLMQGNEIIQITTDQTLAQYQIDNGEIEEDEIDVSDKKVHMLLQAIGASEEIAPDFYFGKTGEFFTFFICSDGMINRVDKEEIKEQLKNSLAKSEKEKIANIMKLAIKRGETDNLTGIIIKKFDPDSIEEIPEEIKKPKKITIEKESEEKTGRI